MISMILAMSMFALSMSISPGPVNLVTLASSINYGIRPTLAFVSGATVGFTLLLLCIGLGVNVLSSDAHVFLMLLTKGGAVFIAYMGYRLLKSNTHLSIERRPCPTWLQGALMQWLNPKAWVACIAGASAFHLSASNTRLLLFVGLYFVICYLSMASWAWLGKRAQSLVNSSKRINILNRAMGISLLFVAIYLWI